MANPATGQSVSPGLKKKQPVTAKVANYPELKDYDFKSKLFMGSALATWMADDASTPIGKKATGKEDHIERIRMAFRRLGYLQIDKTNKWLGLSDAVTKFQKERLEDQNLDARLEQLSGGDAGKKSKLVLGKTGEVDRLTVGLLDLELVDLEAANAQVVCKLKSCALEWDTAGLGAWMDNSASPPLAKGTATPEQIRSIRLALRWLGNTGVVPTSEWGKLDDDVIKFQQAQIEDSDLASTLNFLQVEKGASCLRTTGEVDRITAALLDLALITQVEQDGKLKPPPLEHGNENLDTKADDPRIRHLQECLVELAYATKDDLANEQQGGERPNTEFALIDFQYDWGHEPDGLFGPSSFKSMTKALERGSDGALPHPPSMPDEDANGPKPISYQGGADLAGFPDISNTVQFVQSTKSAIPTAWDEVACKRHVHYSPDYCADVNRKTTNYPDGEIDDQTGVVQVYGPSVPFRVARTFSLPQLGGVVCAYMRDRDVRISFCHLTQISVEVYQAAKTRSELPAGTYIGATADAIGVQQGVHCHLQAGTLRKRNGMRRRDFFPKLRQQEDPLPTDDPQP